MPVEPTREDIFKALNGLVTVTCINRFWKDGNKNMDCGQGQYAAKAGIAGQEYTLEKGENAGTWGRDLPGHKLREVVQAESGAPPVHQGHAALVHPLGKQCVDIRRL